MRAWQIALLLTLVTAVVLLDRPDQTRFWDALFDAGHAPLFGVIALVLFGLTTGPLGRRAWIAFGWVVALGVLTEVLQALQPNREMSAVDLARDAAAGGAFLLLRCARPPSALRPPPPVRETRSRALAALAVVLLVACFAELAVVLAAYVQRSRDMPTIARFDGAWWTRGMVKTGANPLTWPALPRGWTATGLVLARLDLLPYRYSGFSIDEPFPDWRGYRRLVVPIVSDLEEPLKLTLRVHDARHDQRYEDRYNVTLVVEPGGNRFEIPLDDVRRAPDRREMDMSRIRGIVVFAHQLERPSRIYLGPISLE